MTKRDVPRSVLRARDLLPTGTLGRGWSVLIPAQALWGGIIVSVAAGAIAGLYPALRAARITPTDALRTA